MGDGLRLKAGAWVASTERLAVSIGPIAGANLAGGARVRVGRKAGRVPRLVMDVVMVVMVVETCE